MSDTNDFVLVPREPTREMIDNADKEWQTNFACRTYSDVYKAMLSAAPKSASEGLQRYDYDYFVKGMYPHHEGEWVRHSDAQASIAQLEARVGEVEASHRRMHGEWTLELQNVEAAQSRIQALEAALTDAEEALSHLETSLHVRVNPPTSDPIRALLGKEGT